jgi:hypothetical protein
MRILITYFQGLWFFHYTASAISRDISSLFMRYPEGRSCRKSPEVMNFKIFEFLSAEVGLITSLRWK